MGPALGVGGILRCGQRTEGQETEGLELRGFYLEIGLALGVDQGGRGLGKAARRIAAGAMALRLDEYRPSRAEAAEGVIEAAGDGDEFGRHRGIQVGAAKAGGARSEERRGGKGCGSTGGSRWSADHLKKKKNT